MRGYLFTCFTAVWSAVVLPVLPSYAALTSLPEIPAATLPTNNLVEDEPLYEDDGKLSRQLAGFARSGGNALSSDDAISQMRNTATGAAAAEVERWLNGIGNARIQLDISPHFSLKNSSFDLLLPLYDQPEWLVFSQQSLHRIDNSTQVNLGAGIRYFGREWMTGLNAFYDDDLTRYHRRGGIGAEFWRDYLKLGANSYFRLSGWRSAPELDHDYEARPANGWDIRAEGWLPVYPQLGAKLTLEQYYGKDVALFGTNNRQADPLAVTAGLNWTPVPLITLSGEHRTGAHGVSQSLVGLQLNWTPGMSLTQQLDPENVRERRTMAGSRLELVERNNRIVLEYRKKTLMNLALREQVSGSQGQSFALVASLKTTYPLQEIAWSAGAFLAAGGEITGSGTTSRFTLPPYRTGNSAVQTQQLNTYSVSAIARDIHGNFSSRATSTLIVTDTGARIEKGSFTISNGARANGTETNMAVARVTDSTGQPVKGETVTFTLPAGLIAANGSAAATTTRRGQQVKIVTEENGTANLNVASHTPGDYTLTAQVNTAPVATATTQFEVATLAPDTTQSTLRASPASIVANGTASSHLTLTLKDANDAAITGETVTFTVSGAVNVTLKAMDAGNGTYTANLSGTTVGNATVNATVAGSTFAVSPTTVTLTPDNATARFENGALSVKKDNAVADDAEVNTVQAKVVDAYGNVLAGQVVSFSGGSHVNVVTGSGTTDANGLISTDLKSVLAGTHSITATLANTASSTADVKFVAGEWVASKSKLQFNKSSIIANGGSTDAGKSTITLALMDANNNPVTGQNVIFTSWGLLAGTNTLTGVTENQGVYHGVLSGIRADKIYINAEVNGTKLLTSLESLDSKYEIHLNPDASTGTITLDANGWDQVPVAPGTDFLVDITAVDANQNGLYSDPISYTAPAGVTATCYTGCTHENTDNSGYAAQTWQVSVSASAISGSGTLAFQLPSGARASMPLSIQP